VKVASASLIRRFLLRPGCLLHRTAVSLLPWLIGAGRLESWAGKHLGRWLDIGATERLRARRRTSRHRR
jgi:hypothetical protein